MTLASTNALTRISLALLVALAACGAPAICGGCSDGGDDGEPMDTIPNAFRVEAEILSVEPGPGLGESAAALCTPAAEDADPEGPDWVLAFDHVHDAEEPTFEVVSFNENADSAALCADGGGGDCCRPLVAADGGWRLECDGRTGGLSRNRFAFTFNADGSGASTSTLTSNVTGEVVCIAVAEWTAIVPL